MRKISIQVRSGLFQQLCQLCTHQKRDLSTILGNNLDLKSQIDKSISKDGHLLTAAVQHGDTEIVEGLIEYGADVNSTCTGRVTPLIMACIVGRADLASLLIDHGASIHTRWHRNGTPLHVAAKVGSQDVVALLLERGANIDATQQDNITPLFCACFEKHLEVARLLLDHGADPNIPGWRGRSPVYVACQQLNTPVAILLLNYGATEDIGLLLHLACTNKSIDLVTSVASKCNIHSFSPFSNLLHRASGNPKLIKMLLDGGAPTDGRDSKGDTILHIATKYGRVQEVTMLLEMGANIDSTNNEMDTPLHTACSMELKRSHWQDNNRRWKCAEMLVAKGAKVNARNSKGETPIQYLELPHDIGNDTLMANCMERQCYWVVESMIKSRKYNCHVPDANGLTPLHYAFLRDKKHIAESLVELGTSVSDGVLVHAPSSLHIILEWVGFRSKEEYAANLIVSGANVNSVFERNILSRLPKVGPYNKSTVLLLTPLHYAIQQRLIGLVDLLVKSGAQYWPIIALKNPTAPSGIDWERLPSSFQDENTFVQNKETSVWQLCEGNEKILAVLGHSWNIHNHRRHPECIRKAVLSMLMLNKRCNWGLDNSILYRIFAMIAYQWCSTATLEIPSPPAS